MWVNRTYIECLEVGIPRETKDLDFYIFYTLANLTGTGHPFI